MEPDSLALDSSAPDSSALGSLAPSQCEAFCCACGAAFPNICSNEDGACAHCSPLCLPCDQHCCFLCICECDGCGQAFCVRCLKDNGLACESCDRTLCTWCSEDQQEHSCGFCGCDGILRSVDAAVPLANATATIFPLGYDPDDDPSEKIRRLTLQGMDQLPMPCPTELWDEFALRTFSHFVEVARPPRLGIVEKVFCTANSTLSPLPMPAESVPTTLISHLLTPDDIDAVHRHAERIERDHGGPRPLRCHGVRIHTGAAHATTYLHHGQSFARALPDLQERLVAAMRSHWDEKMRDTNAGDPPSERLAVRCVELHSYGVGGSLSSPGHTDKGSCISMSILLDECDAGGAFVTWDNEQRPVELIARRGDAILFHSNRIHNIAPVLAGERLSLVLELWEGCALDHGRGQDMRSVR